MRNVILNKIADKGFQRLGYEKDLNGAKQILKSPKAGMVSYRVDGYENVLTPDCLSSLTIKFFI